MSRDEWREFTSQVMWTDSGRGNSTCQGLAVGMCLEFSRTARGPSVARVE